MNVAIKLWRVRWKVQVLERCGHETVNLKQLNYFRIRPVVAFVDRALPSVLFTYALQCLSRSGIRTVHQPQVRRSPGSAR